VTSRARHCMACGPGLQTVRQERHLRRRCPWSGSTAHGVSAANAEVGRRHVLVGAQRDGRTLEDDGAVIDDVGAVGEL